MQGRPNFQRNDNTIINTPPYSSTADSPTGGCLTSKMSFNTAALQEAA